MRKKISLGAAITFMAITAAVTFSITMVISMTNFNSMVYNLKERESMYEKLSELERLVRQNYYGKIDEETLQANIAKGFLGGIDDPYAAYYTAEQYKTFSQAYAGKSVNIGAKLEKDPSGYIIITELYSSTEDADAGTGTGLAVGDLIIKVDDLDVTADTVDDALERIEGDAGTKVSLMVRREAVDTLVEVTRREVDIPSVYAKLIDTNAYIRIMEFNDNTAVQFEKAVDDMVAQGATGLIFDLRGNDGGTLAPAVEMLDKLLPEGTLVSATYKNEEIKIIAKSDPNQIYLPMMALTDGNTASAAELFVQALRDFGAGKSVGTKTFGKGSMQEQFKLNDGSAVSFTIALYNPPKGESFDGVGLQPDFEVNLTAEVAKELLALDIENVSSDADAQLKKAVEVIEATKKNLAEVQNQAAQSEETTSEDVSQEQSAASQ
ncbi:MAG: S41 family peptidase [Acetanaerobacterium sp.]